jgi:hypothetical protein
LTIVLPNQRTTQGAQRLLKCDGVVVRCSPTGEGRRPTAYQLACSFIGLEPRHRLLLDDFVTWRNLQSIRAVDASPKRPARRPKRATARTAASKTKARRSTARRAASR